MIFINISAEDFKKIMSNVKIIDLRNKYEFSMGSIKNAINLSVNDILYNLDKYLDKSNTYYFICSTGKASYKLSRLLNNNGYKTYSVDGGFNNLIK